MTLYKLKKDERYTTIFIGDEGQKGTPTVLSGEVIDKLHRFRPIGYGQDTTTIFRSDGTVELYGLTLFKDKEDEQ